jgi:hypothetical protein
MRILEVSIVSSSALPQAVVVRVAGSDRHVPNNPGTVPKTGVDVPELARTGAVGVVTVVEPKEKAVICRLEFSRCCRSAAAV